MKKTAKPFRLIERLGASEAMLCGQRCALPESGNLDRALKILTRLAADADGNVHDSRITPQLVLGFVEALDYASEQNREVTIRNFRIVQDVVDFVEAANDFMHQTDKERLSSAKSDRAMRSLERQAVYAKLSSHFGIGCGDLTADTSRYHRGVVWFYEYWDKYINGDPIVTRLVRGIRSRLPDTHFDFWRTMYPKMDSEIDRIQAI